MAPSGGKRGQGRTAGSSSDQCLTLAPAQEFPTKYGGKTLSYTRLQLEIEVIKAS